MKAPTKAEFKALLQREIQSWSDIAENLPDGSALKEQAIGRKEQCTWLLQVFGGELPIPPVWMEDIPVILENRN